MFYDMFRPRRMDEDILDYYDDEDDEDYEYDDELDEDLLEREEVRLLLHRRSETFTDEIPAVPMTGTHAVRPKPQS